VITVAVAEPVKFIVNPSSFPEIDAIRERTLHELIDRLRDIEGDNLIKVSLYGSVARGDARVDSDTDVFILLRSANGDPIDRIVEITVDIDMNTGDCRTHITPDVFDLETYNYKKQFGGFFKNLNKDGIILYDAT
jgi:predicted nucleotidyltransferase